jgi:hypothetical protein
MMFEQMRARAQSMIDAIDQAQSLHDRAGKVLDVVEYQLSQIRNDTLQTHVETAYRPCLPRFCDLELTHSVKRSD